MRWGRGISLGSGMQRMVTSIGGKEHADKARITEVWHEVVGEQVAKHTAVRGVERGKLIVDVDSSVWASQLQVMSAQLKDGINEAIGRKLVSSIVFRPSQRVEKTQAEHRRLEESRRGYGGDKVEPTPLTEAEAKAARELVADIRNERLREAALDALVAEKEWQKGRGDSSAE